MNYTVFLVFYFIFVYGIFFLVTHISYNKGGNAAYKNVIDTLIAVKKGTIGEFRIENQIDAVNFKKDGYSIEPQELYTPPVISPLASFTDTKISSYEMDNTFFIESPVKIKSVRYADGTKDDFNPSISLQPGWYVYIDKKFVKASKPTLAQSLKMLNKKKTVTVGMPFLEVE